MSNAVALYDQFRGELDTRMEDDLATILPAHINPEKFKNTALIAIKNNPALLNTDRRSLHRAITQAAEDGLNADGREGVITPFKGQAQWNPMIGGIRKRAAEVAGMIIDAQVVYADDHFVWRQGDNPGIDHEPAGLGMDRGKPVGAYAIFKRGDEILHREVMDVKQINEVKSMSVAKNGPLWTKWWDQAWIKTVIRRGIKSVPTVPELERVVQRVDQDFPQFNRGASNVVELSAHEPAGEIEALVPPSPDDDTAVDYEVFLEAVERAKTSKQLDAVWSRYEERMPDDNSDFVAAHEARMNEIEGSV